jgi:hypothetical protein
MDEARNLTRREFVMNAIFEAPDRRHVAIAFEKKLSAVLHGSSQSLLFCEPLISGSRYRA